MLAHLTSNSDERILIFEPSGEHESLPAAEIIACLVAENAKFTVVEQGKGILIIKAKELNIEDMKERLALTHHINRHLISCEVSKIFNLDTNFEIGYGSFAARAKRIQRSHMDINLKDVEKIVAKQVKGENKVDLTDPDIEMRVVISERCHIGIKLADIDRNSFEKRKVQFRPYFSPVSLHPRLARALVNLSRVKRGQSLLDPFCGTGGILIESALIGAKTIGSDIDNRMVSGSRKNLNTFNIKEVTLFRADVSEVAGRIEKVDAIATDPPYGRSATTNREEISSLYGRAFDSFSKILRDGGYVSIVLPDEESIKIGENYMNLEESHTLRVHRSLTRNFCVFKKV